MKMMMAIAVCTALTTVAMVEGIAHADPACAAREASIYFEKGRSDVTPSSQEIVDRIASDAKACGRLQILADAPDGPLESQRAVAVSNAFAAKGVQVILVGARGAAPSSAKESVLDRAAAIRVQFAPPNS